MVRETEFRGKTQITNCFVYGYYIRQYGCRNGIKFFTDFIYSEDEIYYPIDINTLGQYTGLKDKNGVKIFEGDILRIYGGEKMFGYYEFDQVKVIKELEDLVMLSNLDCGIEVIGNIYENKELLENE